MSARRLHSCAIESARGRSRGPSFLISDRDTRPRGSRDLHGALCLDAAPSVHNAREGRLSIGVRMRRQRTVPRRWVSRLRRSFGRNRRRHGGSGKTEGKQGRSQSVRLPAGATWARRRGATESRPHRSTRVPPPCKFRLLAFGSPARQVESRRSRNATPIRIEHAGATSSRPGMVRRTRVRGNGASYVPMSGAGGNRAARVRTPRGSGDGTTRAAPAASAGARRYDTSGRYNHGPQWRPGMWRASQA